MPIPSSPAPVTQQRVLLRHVVHDRISDAIMSGELKPGELLDDKALGEWLQVSRTPIRDALNELARAGLVEMAPNRYTRVASSSTEEALDALRALGVLLSGVARLAVAQLPRAATKNLSRILDRAIAACRTGDGITFSQAMLEAAKQYARHCGNQALAKICDDSLDGLSFKLHIPDLAMVLDFDVACEHLDALKVSTNEGSPLTAAQAIEALHLLPDPGGSEAVRA